MKIVYTESALDELDRFQRQRKEDLESLLKNTKYVFGDDVLEITASDIREAEACFRVSSESPSILTFSSMMLKLYTVAGMILASVGVFYPQLMRMSSENPSQLMLILGGLLLSSVSFAMSYYLKVRALQRHAFEKKIRSFESKTEHDP